MPKIPITIPQDASGAWNLAPVDYQTLLNALLLSANPDGTIIQLTLTGQVYNAAVVAQNLQTQEATIQTELNQATAAEQDINP